MERALGGLLFETRTSPVQVTVASHQPAPIRLRSLKALQASMNSGSERRPSISS
jgi:hypothetical protein